ncbi:glycerophosphodiester phosphodiesterase [Aquirhabdus sp.]|uniref:glycerophosphodiester phosphodiesterase n=1 Tax=Aquirhabdus sp. TaxID=2824160 RepID=UPI00396C9CAD
MKIIGHRGARGEAPENTLGGFQHIINLGLKAVEFDVRLLKDGQLAVLHDATLQRTAGQPDLLLNLNITDLNRFDNRQGWADWTHPEPVPSLQQVLYFIIDFEHIEVEVKAVEDQTAVEDVCLQLIEELDGWANAKAITVTSFDVRILAELKRLRDDLKHTLKTGLLLELHSDTPHHSDMEGSYEAVARDLGCTRIGLSDKLATASAIAAIKQANLQLSIWTVNSIERAKELQSWGVDGLITDHPTRMLHNSIGNR